MHIDLSGKTALITGASAGIGLAIARGLAQAGARVTLSARDADRLNAAVAALQADGLQAQGVAADLATPAGCQALIAALPDTDILVNNLGIYGTQDFFAISDADWEHYFQTNVMSGLRLSRHYAQGMRARVAGAASSSSPANRR